MSLHQGRGIAAQRCYGLYLPADVDMPFVRDSPRNSWHVRLGTHEIFALNLQSMVRQYLLLSGMHEERLTKAIDLLLMRETWNKAGGFTVVGEVPGGGNRGV